MKPNRNILLILALGAVLESKVCAQEVLPKPRAAYSKARLDLRGRFHAGFSRAARRTRGRTERAAHPRGDRIPAPETINGTGHFPSKHQHDLYMGQIHRRLPPNTPRNTSRCSATAPSSRGLGGLHHPGNHPVVLAAPRRPTLSRATGGNSTTSQKYNQNNDLAAKIPDKLTHCRTSSTSKRQNIMSSARQLIAFALEHPASQPHGGPDKLHLLGPLEHAGRRAPDILNRPTPSGRRDVPEGGAEA